MMSRMVDVRRALIALLMLWTIGAHAAGPVPADAVAPAHDQSETVQEWTVRAEHGDREASAHLCALYFDGRGGVFDPAKTVTWCQRSAAAGDARAMQRMGLLALAGVGVPKEIDEAARLCAAAHSHDPTVSAGFCLAAVAKERRNAAETTDLPEAATAPAPDPKLEAAMARWRDLANRGDRAASAQLCEIYFNARDGTFDPVKTIDWCRRAARYGDARALRRLGMMRLWGVGIEKGSPQAEALCNEAQRRDPAVSAAFCLAAVEAKHTQAISEAGPSDFAYPAPWPAALNPEMSSKALGPDRVLETVHVTATGLHYSCGDFIRWARYGLPLSVEVFGRSLQQFREQDYTALDQAAAACAVAIAPYDQDNGMRDLLAKFRPMLVQLEQRQRELVRAAQEKHAENVAQNHADAKLRRQVMVLVPTYSDTQAACVQAISRAWVAGDFNPKASLLEIRSAATNDVGGNTVVSGLAQIVETSLGSQGKLNTYSCTFAGSSQRITAKTLRPLASP